LIPIACWKTAEAVSAKSRFSLFCCFFDLRFDLGMSNPQHPDWVEPNGNCPTCDSYESRLAELLGLSHRTNSVIPSVAASEALREIAWENDRQFA